MSFYYSIIKVINYSRDNLARAEALAGNRKACCEEARKIYGKQCRGMYKHIELKSKKLLEVAKKTWINYQ